LMPFIAYKITHRESGKAYVGVTTKALSARWREHINQVPHRRTALGSAIRKYGMEAFDVLHIASMLCKDSMLATERLLIEQEQTKSPYGYNLTAGGEGVFDPAPEARKRLSDSLKGKQKSVAHRAKIAAYSPQRLTPEVRARISAKLKGRPTGRKPDVENSNRLRVLNESRRGIALTDEHRAAISKGQTGLKRPEGTGAKISATKIGKKQTEATKAKIAATRLARYGSRRPGWNYEESVSS
jgi:group I intron endonuclease